MNTSLSFVQLFSIIPDSLILGWASRANTISRRIHNFLIQRRDALKENFTLYPLFAEQARRPFVEQEEAKEFNEMAALVPDSLLIGFTDRERHIGEEIFDLLLQRFEKALNNASQRSYLFEQLLVHAGDSLERVEKLLATSLDFRERHDVRREFEFQTEGIIY